ncbi:hypothetical protein T10_13650, partial [Trichinella papuae]
LRVSWNKILGYNKKCVNQSTDCDDDWISVIKMFEKVKLSRDEVEQWLADDDTPLFEILTDNEILKAVEKDENEDVDVSDKPNEGLSHSEAYSCLIVGLKWMEKQKEFSATQLMLMRHHRDITAQKKLSSFKQKFIADYIEYDIK